MDRYRAWVGQRDAQSSAQLLLVEAEFSGDQAAEVVTGDGFGASGVQYALASLVRDLPQRRGDVDGAADVVGEHRSLARYESPDELLVARSGRR